jgi:hypothetical protein
MISGALYFDAETPRRRENQKEEKRKKEKDIKDPIVSCGSILLSCFLFSWNFSASLRLCVKTFRLPRQDFLLISRPS